MNTRYLPNFFLKTRNKKKTDGDNLNIVVKLADLAMQGILLITVICIFVPFSPDMPSSSLDPSWVFGMNQSVANGFYIGSDIIFTFGPYASVYTKSYHPSTDFMMVSSCLYLALSYWVCLAFLAKGVQKLWVLTYWVLMAGFMYSRDSLFFSLPLLVGLLIFKIFSTEKESPFKNKILPLYIGLIFAPLGLLPLVKGSIFILCAAISVISFVFFVIKREKFLALASILSPIISMIFFWVVSGQPLVKLPNYFISLVPIISGYTEAMASNGRILEIFLYLITSIFLLSTISINSQETKTSKLFLFLIYFFFLFISFKGGFVRHDSHAIMSGTSILIAGLLLPFILKTKNIYPVIIFSLLTWALIDSSYVNSSTRSIGRNFFSTYSSAWNGFKNRTKNKNWLKSEFDAKVNSLRIEASFPILKGTTDIYSYNQSYLISSGNHWSPRPIFQSYSVYTPVLAEINKKHLIGPQAPDNIIFRVEPIDGRIPSIEDGPSWPILISNYQPTQLENDFLFLRKKENIFTREEHFDIKQQIHRFGEVILLPSSNQPLFIKIDIRPTLLGKIANFFFKASRLQITVVLNNGIKKPYRIIAGMAKSGFIISPLIENTAEFGMLYGKVGLLNDKLVKSISIEPVKGKSLLWKEEYEITYSQIR